MLLGQDIIFVTAISPIGRWIAAGGFWKPNFESNTIPLAHARRKPLYTLPHEEFLAYLERADQPAGGSG